jgi:hypothetical protein
MELQPASPSLLEALRSGSGLDLPPPAPAVESRPVTPHRVTLTRTTPAPADEVLIPDARAGLTPAQSVERKLSVLLRGGAIPASHFRLARLCRKP